jgi:hypothetical protein
MINIYTNWLSKVKRVDSSQLLLVYVCCHKGNNMFHHSKDESSDFLPNLTKAFKSIDINNAIATKEFVEACARVEPIFDHIGTSLLLNDSTVA